MLSSKDISVVIPTYNRYDEVKITLNALKPFIKHISEIIVVDQSKDTKTRDLVKSLKNNKIKYIFSQTPSITIARNLGVAKSSAKSKLICFLDDDVTIQEGYFDEILRVFNEKNAYAVGGVDSSSYDDEEKQKFHNIFLKKLFFLGHYEKNKARILSAYGNTYPMNLQKTIKSEWLPGVNMAYKKEIFKDMKFDENLLGYTVVEDIDF